MNKLIELEGLKYDEFVKNHPTKSHFLQSYAWGEFAKAKKNMTPYYVGLIDDENNILAATLLLQKKLKLGYSYFYAPRGFVIDYQNSNLFNEFTKEIVNFAKKKKGLFVKIDPDIIRKSYNYLNEENELEYNSDEIMQMILKAGFKHLGFTKNFETMQPRYTFRINLEQSLEDIENHFSKTTKQRLNKAEKLGVNVRIGTEKDLDIFCNLMLLTENRKDFASYNDDYYKTFYKMFNENNKALLFLGSVNLKKIIDILENQIKDNNVQLNSLETNIQSKSSKNKYSELLKQKSNLINELEKYKEIAKEQDNEIVLNAHMIVIYKDKAWVLYAGNHNILTETYANYYTYDEHIRYCKKHDIKIYDQFGTIGDLSKNNPRLGLHEFKKKFGGDYVEFLGEFDYIINPIMYFLFLKLVPFYRKLNLMKAKKEIKRTIK